MVKTDAISRLLDFEPELRAMGARAAFLFGSTARGDQDPGSDIDVLLDVPRGTRFTLLDLAAARRLLAEGLDADVDLTIRADLSASVEQRIMREAAQIF